MNYKLLGDLLNLAEQFDLEAEKKKYSQDIHGFKAWWTQTDHIGCNSEVEYLGKENGRSPDSVINTLFVHLNRYARTYAKAAIHGSPFSTPDDFIYLITLTTFGAMSKSTLIRQNIHDKPTGIQIINRLIKRGWVVQVDAEGDKRSKIVSLTMSGAELLNDYMDKIRVASQIVTGSLTENEKVSLIRLLTKLDVFHQEIFKSDVLLPSLLDAAWAVKKQQQV